MKRTRKYVAALEIATLDHSSSEEFYQKLNELGFFWNGIKGKWIRDDRLADPPTNLIRLRLWANKDNVDDLAEEITQILAQHDYRLEGKSEAYICRPPKQNEARIYLEFTKLPNN